MNPSPPQTSRRRKNIEMAPPSDFQNEAIESVREITLQLILISMGIFAVMGGFATSEHRKFVNRGWIWAAFLLLGVSVIFGMLAYGSLIYSLSHSDFSIGGPLSSLARVQWVCFSVGGLLFMVAVLLNIRK